MKRWMAWVAALAALPGAALAQSSPSAFTSGTRYDVMRRVVGTIASDPDGSGSLHYAATRSTYDTAGRLTRVETGELAAWQAETVAPASWTGFTVLEQVDTTYDALDRKLKETHSAGGTTYEVAQYSYDAVGRPLCAATRMDPSQWGSRTDACVPQLTGPNGPDRIVKTVYDVAGQVVQVRKGVGTSLEQAYATYSFTGDGKQQDLVDANGNHAQLTYDGFDRAAAWYFPSTTMAGSYNPSTPANALSTAGAVNTADYEQYGYDANGNRTSFRKRDGRTLTYAYDALNRVTSKVVPDGCAPIQAGACPAASATRDVYYGYDLRGLQLYARFDSATG